MFDVAPWLGHCLATGLLIAYPTHALATTTCDGFPTGLSADQLWGLAERYKARGLDSQAEQALACFAHRHSDDPRANSAKDASTEETIGAKTQRPEEDLELLIERADRLFDAENYELAAKFYEDRLQADDSAGDTRAYVESMLSEARRRHHAPQGSSPANRSATPPDHAEADRLAQRAVRLSRLGDTAEARRYARRALLLNPSIASDVEGILRPAGAGGNQDPEDQEFKANHPERAKATLSVTILDRYKMGRFDRFICLIDTRSEVHASLPRPKYKDTVVGTYEIPAGRDVLTVSCDGSTISIPFDATRSTRWDITVARGRLLGQLKLVSSDGE